MAGFTFKKIGTEVHNGGSVSAGSDIIAAATVNRHGILHVVVAVDTSTTVQLTINDGTTEEVMDLNGGAALAAATLYSFPVPALQGYDYSLINASGGSATTIQHAAMLLETPVG